MRVLAAILGKHFVPSASAAHVRNGTLRCGSRKLRLFPQSGAKTLFTILGKHFVPSASAAVLCAVFFAVPVFAQTPGRFDAKQPIEITADTLEVQQQDNVATFSGNVVAIQGEVRLRADRMTVYYRGSEEKKEADAQAIKKIDVEGNVFLSTPDETASGAHGDYDVLREEIHLNKDVTLTRGKNVLKGNTLTYNFATGRSIITGGAVAESGESKGQERVRALFVPDEKEEKE